MGSCASRRRMQAEDRAQEKIAEFVRYAISSDLVKLREMITKGKMNPNAKDIPTAAMHYIMLAEKITTRLCVISFLLPR
ncbi:Methylmalonic aciduria type A [Phytophthora nicotianae]|uniref:Methylmalonic aciduria type A n=1 Tax=Phytophthora nicotianae TaxID=4792 RepID=A0A0W8D5W6_PHYNI|nr:Methylmalonic aciduria type A [Phytophthora nicotianae]